jgi:hypothetical protein
MPLTTLVAFRAAAKYLTAMIAFFATVIYLGFSLYEQVVRYREQVAARDREATMQRALAEEESRLQEMSRALEQQLNALKINLDNTSHNPPQTRELIGLQQRADGLSSELAQLHQEVNSLDAALTTNPEKALTVPLLRKDVDDLKTETQRQIDELKGEMTRGYDLNRWLIGLILAAVVGTVINNVVQAKAKTEKPATFE